MANCLELNIPQVKKDLKELTNIFKNQNIAHYLLSENNGYNLDLDKNGNPSELFKDLKKNRNRKQAILDKSLIYSPEFKEQKPWTLEEPNVMDIMFFKDDYKELKANVSNYSKDDIVLLKGDIDTKLVDKAVADKVQVFVTDTEKNYLLEKGFIPTKKEEVIFYTKELQEDEKKNMKENENILNINGTVISLKKLGFDFKLTQDQIKTVQEVSDWIDGKKLKQKLTNSYSGEISSLKKGEVYAFNPKESESANKAINDFGRDKAALKGFYSGGTGKQTYSIPRVSELYEFAYNYPKTKIYVGLKDVKYLNSFVEAGTIPNNLVFEESFLGLLNKALPNKVKDNFLLTGYAGTGKTTVMAIILEYAKKNASSMLVSATTDKAVRVQEKMYGESIRATTLHSALGLAPDIDIEEFDVSKLKFKPLNNPKVQYGSLLLIDEASMINDDLYTFLKDHSKTEGYKIIFVGDDKQLKPVKQKKKSSIFDITDKYVSKLITQVRQSKGNSLSNTLIRLRLNQNTNSEPLGSTRTSKVDSTNNEGIEWVNGSGFRDHIKSLFSSDSYKNNSDFVKVIAYKNDTVSNYNKFVRQLLGHTEEIVEGELLMGYTKLTDFKKVIVSNSVEYIVTKKTDVKRNISHPLNKDISVDVEGIEVSLQDSLDEYSRTSSYILSTNNSDKIKVTLAKMAYETLQEYFKQRKINKSKAKSIYSSYKKFQNSFLNFEDLTVPGINNKYGKPLIHKKKSIDYGYAITSHKSQGSTYDYAMVDESDINEIYRFDVEATNQSKYVAFSRASKGVIAKTSAEIENTEQFDFNKPSNYKETISVNVESNDVVNSLLRDGLAHKDCK